MHPVPLKPGRDTTQHAEPRLSHEIHIVYVTWQSTFGRQSEDTRSVIHQVIKQEEFLCLNEGGKHFQHLL
jgi:hypothetical protein